jgi:hypothetical protein
MKKTKKIILLVVILLGMDVFYSCSNARWGTDAGLSMTWGPNGPRVRPHVDFDIFNGGRL